MHNQDFLAVVDDPPDAAAVLADFQAQAPAGLVFTHAETLPPGTPKLAVAAADYRIGVPADRQAEIAARVAERPFIRSAREEPVDPDLFRKKPTGVVVFGIFLILFSYVIGWPAVAVFGWLSFHTGQPLILVVGGPVTYGLSHLVFMAGLFLAGKPYAPIYDLAMAEASRVAGRPVKRAEVLAIGDGPETDIRGAADYGLPALLVAEGVTDASAGLHVAEDAVQRAVPHARIVATVHDLSWT